MNRLGSEVFSDGTIIRTCHCAPSVPLTNTLGHTCFMNSKSNYIREIKHVLMSNFVKFLILGIVFLLISSCDVKPSRASSGTYVKPTVTRTGQIRKGYVRKKYSTSKDAVRNRMRSRYYYHSRGKYRRRH